MNYCKNDYLLWYGHFPWSSDRWRPIFRSHCKIGTGQLHILFLWYKIMKVLLWFYNVAKITKLSPFLNKYLNIYTCTQTITITYFGKTILEFRASNNVPSRWNTYIHYPVFKNRSMYPIQKVKIVKPVFNCLRLLYNFERSSSYVTRFKKILRSLYEGGIDRYLDYKNQTELSHTDDGSVTKNLFTLKLTVLLFSGYTLSSVAFFIECIVMCFFNNVKRHYKYLVKYISS